ncbi:MAG: Holliday junction branch migration protein RuvA [Actinobacteria bacterium]|nr:Holliday junction branch migration protein RuvA [Actinomycetota bacterium]
MICSLRGTLTTRTSNAAVIETGGVGYYLRMSSSSLSALGKVGDDAFVWTYMSVREDSISLFGFATEPEKALFEKLIGVSGIGPKVALSALSSFAASSLANTIAAGDVSRIATIPGVGKKTAQRIVLELKGSLDEFIGGSLWAEESEVVDFSANEALLGMGFSSAEAELALQGYDGEKSDINEAIRYALKRLGSNR